ncbi:MAG: nitrilase-related carbon-nitrogen hydrolase [Thermodesulfobacteriota bacterium]|nr:nitrilase-related carbon-nitrogen hydrolase [Thermodesulfobacteriota bacterium]
MNTASISVGMCQLRQGYDTKENLERALAMIHEASVGGADIAVLPEMFICPYEPAAVASAVHITQKALDSLSGCALKNHIYIVAGSLPVDSGNSLPYNTSVVLDPSGSQVFRHDKIHLFDCTPPGGDAVKESSFVRPGNHIGTFDTPWGRASVVICYDLRFTPLVQLLADQGTGLLFVPAAFSLVTGRAHWEMLIKMRALELQGFVIGVQPAYNTGLNYVPWGHSMAASPWGKVLMDAGQDAGVRYVDLDIRAIAEIKQRFPLLSHRRKDLYETRWMT